MVFFLNLICSLIYCYYIGKQYKLKKNQYYFGILILLFPIIILWLLICSGQYYVGTDYPAYIDIFNGNNLDRYEPGFLLMITSLFKIGITGQIIYLFFYTIGFLFLFLNFKELDTDLRYLFLFIILYICVSNLFNNQLNILRQAIATYIGSYGFICYVKNSKAKGMFWILISSTIHLAALVLLIVIFTPLLKHINNTSLKWIIIIGFLLSMVIKIDYFYSLTDFLPPSYSSHIEYYDSEKRSLLILLTKYMYLPLYMVSCKLVKSYESIKLKHNLIKWGIIGYSLRLSLLNVPLISRVADYYILISIIPLYFLLKNLLREQSNIARFILIILIILYFTKTVVFPSAEYNYNSIYQFIF